MKHSAIMFVVLLASSAASIQARAALVNATATGHQTSFGTGVHGTIDGSTAGGMGFFEVRTVTTDIAWEVDPAEAPVNGPGTLSFQMDMNLGAAHTLQKFRLYATDADRSLFADSNPPTGTNTPAGDVDPSPGSWTLLSPTSAASAGGATLAVDGAGIITASGANPDVDTYTITADNPLGNITGFRLEVMPGADTFVGRASNGNAVLSEFSFTFEANPIPEPSTLVLAALGLVGLVASGRRRRRQ